MIHMVWHRIIMEFITEVMEIKDMVVAVSLILEFKFWKRRIFSGRGRGGRGRGRFRQRRGGGGGDNKENQPQDNSEEKQVEGKIFSN